MVLGKTMKFLKTYEGYAETVGQSGFNVVSRATADTNPMYPSQTTGSPPAMSRLGEQEEEIDSYEEFVSKFDTMDNKDEIPLNIIIWCLQHYYTNEAPTMKIPTITEEFSNKNKEYLKKKLSFRNNDPIWRGVGVDKVTFENIKQNGYKPNPPESWSFDLETSVEFSNFGNISLLIEKPLNEFDKILVMDYVINNTTEEQLKELNNMKHKGGNTYKWIYEFYSSESEIVSFDSDIISYHYIGID